MSMKLSQSDLHDTLQRKSDELAIMMDIGKALTSCLDLQEVLLIIMGKISALLKPKSWSLLLVDRNTDELYFEIVVSPVAEQLKKVRLKMGEGIAGWVAVHGQPLLITDVENDPRFARYVDREVSFTTRSIICVPLKVKDRVLGIIELINSFEDTLYTEADLRILSVISDYAAIAIENARNHERLCELVITDELTGLYNARHFDTIIDREVANARRCSLSMALIFLDIDYFKKVNDTHGHLVGSRILAELGRIIKQNIRITDYAARFGGDEYVILLTNLTKEDTLRKVSQLRDVVRGERFQADDGTEIRITASFGISVYPDHATSKTGLMSLADKAMYAVKESTRDGIRVSRE